MATSERIIVHKSLFTRLTLSSVAARRASKNYEQNTRMCPLYILPYEIVQHVGKHLDYADLTCFALSSYKYADALLSVRASVSGDEAMVKEVTHRRNRDHFNGRDHCLITWIARGLGQMYCVGCSTPHMPSRFPENTMAQSAHLRKCFRASDGPLHMCPHNEFTFQELAGILRKNEKRGRRNKYGEFFHCMECYESFYTINRSGRCMHPPTLYLMPGTSTVILRTKTLLLSIPWTESVTVQKTRDALLCLLLIICPHMNAFDPTTINRLIGQRKNIMMEGCSSGRISIECLVCQTTFSIRRKIPYSEVTVEIERRLGQVRWEGDPIWRAHLPRRDDWWPRLVAT
ncbi:hypothetical protein ACJQWK_07632 [Exserohilum turcicum]|uniref:F-box domain-containing protein n=1 Tax=Exserohilum turcicum (strain 28A) TaxID=671987 RepID=R0J0M9_EXST2|nr:uncharacterized protein SETTUDRAFT_36972 [Exserohilum turcica Et28A]EOA90326.1 hypothetical protein SETTUDRAFT_36972 [Exserohilum turcica Et28A]